MEGEGREAKGEMRGLGCIARQQLLMTCFWGDGHTAVHACVCVCYRMCMQVCEEGGCGEGV